MSTSTIWHQVYSILGQGPGISALGAAVPVLTLLYLLGIVRKPAWMASLAGRVELLRRDRTLGLAFAPSGALFPFFSGWLGWLVSLRITVQACT